MYDTFCTVRESASFERQYISLVIAETKQLTQVLDIHFAILEVGLIFLWVIKRRVEYFTPFPFRREPFLEHKPI